MSLSERCPHFSDVRVLLLYLNGYCIVYVHNVTYVPVAVLLEVSVFAVEDLRPEHSDDALGSRSVQCSERGRREREERGRREREERGRREREERGRREREEREREEREGGERSKAKKKQGCVLHGFCRTGIVVILLA